jgi:hypothetical protein
MRIRLRVDSLKETEPMEYVFRFAFGGVVTVLAGFVADHYGPVLGGLFLAFPGIFPAGVSLVEKHKTLRERAEGKTRSLVGTWASECRGNGGFGRNARPNGICGGVMARTANAQLPAYAIYRDGDVDCGVVALLVGAREDVKPRIPVRHERLRLESDTS